MLLDLAAVLLNDIPMQKIHSWLNFKFPFSLINRIHTIGLLAVVMANLVLITS